MLRGVAVAHSQNASRAVEAKARTNLAFLRHASTSEGKDEEICGWVAVAEASQLRGGCRTPVMAILC